MAPLGKCLLALAALSVALSGAACAASGSTPASAPANTGVPTASTVSLELRVIEVSGAVASVDVTCRNVSPSAMEFTRKQAMCNLTVHRSGATSGLTTATVVPVALDYSTPTGDVTGASPASPAAAVPPGEALNTIKDLPLPGPGAWVIVGEMTGIPDVRSRPVQAVVR
jgi:hypothetical protein